MRDEIKKRDPTVFTSDYISSKFTTIGRHENVKEEAGLKAREEAERRLKEKEQEQEEEQRAQEREASGWMPKQEAGGKETTASRSRLRIRAILEKQAKQRVCCSTF